MSSPSGQRSDGHHVDNRYELRGLLGRGADGQVYRVHDEHLDIDVALKLLEPVRGQVATWDEAQLLEQLRSDFLIPVFNADVEYDSDIRYITMPIMVGGDLEAAIRKRPVDMRQASRWCQQVAHGLERVHTAGLLHRDVKPGNVYLNSVGDAQLGDLGKAIRLDGSGRSTPDGTLFTAAPEVLVVDEPHCSVRTDVYSLAATAFFVFSGEYPVDHRLGRSVEARNKIISGDIRNLGDVAPHVPSSMIRIIMQSLSGDPRKRAENPLQFANKLANAQHLSRNWRQVPSHEGHTFCLRAEPVKSTKAVNVCAVKEGQRYDIHVAFDSGRRVRASEREGLTFATLPSAIRRVVRGL